jgi:glycosyltransferase involved in cell wall biosynthesis
MLSQLRHSDQSPCDGGMAVPREPFLHPKATGRTTPHVSAIIPAFNAQDHIVEAVSSALGQQGVATEVIVVDDGSTDDTWEVLERFGQDIRKVRQPNGGPARARNHGASLARGEWLAFLDADDLWAPEKLAAQLRAADEKTVVVYTDRLNFGDCDRVKALLSESVPLWEGDVFRRLVLDNFVTLSSAMIRKAVFDRLGGFEERLAGTEDWDLWLRAAGEGEFRVCRRPLTHYRWHAKGISNRLEQMQAQRIETLRRAAGLPQARRVSPLVFRRARARTWEAAAWYAAPLDRWKAFHWYMRSACCWPWRITPYKGLVKCLIGRS